MNSALSLCQKCSIYLRTMARTLGGVGPLKPARNFSRPLSCYWSCKHEPKTATRLRVVSEHVWENLQASTSGKSYNRVRKPSWECDGFGSGDLKNFESLLSNPVQVARSVYDSEGTQSSVLKSRP